MSRQELALHFWGVQGTYGNDTYDPLLPNVWQPNVSKEMGRWTRVARDTWHQTTIILYELQISFLAKV